MASLELCHLTKRYGHTLALADINLQADDQEFISLVGPSGCGKTTLLRIIAGLEQANHGSVSIDGNAIDKLPPRSRDVAMVFQGESLYPHLSVFDNLAFPLRMRKFPKAEVEKLVRQASETVGVAEYLRRMPNTLSGGQRQRVAIGRAVVRNPQVLLLDEPFSHLDTHLRRQLRQELCQLHQNWNATILFVTHDQQDAMSLADRVAVMNQGTIDQFDTPQRIRQQPANEFVANFVCQPDW